ncbi:ABCB family ABC transporter ATP-binding protein/permease [Aestuariivirga sp. YIM B02566]|uniref:ABC transporter ATP-binding protein/permease n=1 Tax=Taklimakanibacter albus TaxID=2800327 RepID=A0ACC5R9Q9_9HYPH|nr:ABC transporter ATP-binding protein/permease [Aestuariivirga sp. YIM B02566]MBK1869416.1 ABC transporter ATP-binding protein/permease [Aestuariivirga sp. YIM B02566]
MTRPTPHQAALRRGDGSHWGTLKDIMPLLWPEGRMDLKVRVVLAVVALVLAKVITVLTPFAYKYAVDALTVKDGLPALVVVPAFMILAYGVGRVMMVAFAQLRDAIFAKVGQRAVRELAMRTFRHLHALSLKFHLERRTGGLSRIISRGTNGIDTILRYSLFNTFPTALELLFICGILAHSYGWLYALVVAGTVLAYIIYTYIATEWRINIRRAANDADTDASTKAIDSLLNFETVKYFGNEEHEARRYDVAMARYEKASIKTWISLAILNAGQALIFAIGLTVAMLMSGYAVQKGTMTLGDFVMINALMIQLYMPLNFIGSVYRDIKQGLIDVEEMFSLLEVEADIKDRPGAVPLRTAKGEIIFEHVDFAYDKERPILRDLSFRVPSGKTVAIVGPSGAGKSTISRLLFRFYDVSAGRILVDGQDIAGVTQKTLRAAIGMVPQDTVLFNDTVRYNIRYGRPEASDEEVEDAARLAQVHSFVMTLPKGYEALVGERGLKLSGGEKQRVSIARTILKSPPILILDEATSALDSMTEREIQTALGQVSRNRTTLVIAHRLTTVVEADEIIVLEHGGIAERGTHGELLKQRGLYAAMWNRQREADEARRKLADIEHEEEDGAGDGTPGPSIVAVNSAT